MNHEREELRVTSDARCKLTREYKSVLEYISSWLDRESYAVLSDSIVHEKCDDEEENKEENSSVNLITICCQLRRSLFEVCASGSAFTLQVKMSGGSTRYYGFLNGRLVPERFRTFVTPTTKAIQLPHVHMARSSGVENTIIPILTKDRFGIAILILDCAALKKAASMNTNNDAERILESSALKVYYRARNGRLLREFDIDQMPASQSTSSSSQRRQNLLHVKNSADLRELLILTAVRDRWRPHKYASLLISL